MEEPKINIICGNCQKKLIKDAVYFDRDDNSGDIISLDILLKTHKCETN